MVESFTRYTKLGRVRPFVQDMVCHFPPHQTFCEVFGGDVSVLLAKPPSKVDVFNDNDSELVNLFRVVRDKKAFVALQAGLENTLYAREEFLLAQERATERIERARRFVVRHWQSNGGDWAYSVSKSNRGRASAIAQWDSALKALLAIHRRMKTVQVEHDHWNVIIKRYGTPQTLFYIDMPYIPPSTDGGVLNGIRSEHYEFFVNQYAMLLRAIGSNKGMVALRSYGFEHDLCLEAQGWEHRGLTNDPGDGIWLCPESIKTNLAKVDNAAQQILF